MRGTKYTAREKQKALKMWLEEKNDILYVAKKMKCDKSSLWRWKKQYDGTLASLENGSSRPHTPHPNSHTEEEAKWIRDILDENPGISYTEAYGRLRTEKAYSRTYFGFYQYVVRHNIRPAQEKEKYVPKPYDTPLMLGKKMQMDVKFVPRECNKGEFPEEWIYQYTMIDEATRERFIYPYKEHCGFSTVDFIKRALVYFGYLPEVIQTDNGTEFTNPRGTGEGKVHIVDKLLNQLKIEHRLIRAYTPRHNGKVERSHRSDQESFYNHLTFTTFEELRDKMKEWLERYNNRPHSALRDKNGKRSWQTPREKRQELLEEIEQHKELYRIRFLKKEAA